jgi:hypothetical protein
MIYWLHESMEEELRAQLARPRKKSSIVKLAEDKRISRSISATSDDALEHHATLSRYSIARRSRSHHMYNDAVAQMSRLINS